MEMGIFNMRQLYSLSATINYDNGNEVDTPTHTNVSFFDLGVLINKLIKDRKQASSFVITVCKEPKGLTKS